MGIILKYHGIKTVFKPPKKIGQALKPVKDYILFGNHGVYAVPCGDCQATSIVETKRQIRTWLKEHQAPYALDNR